MGNILRMLWIDIVKPILDFLGYTVSPLYSLTSSHN
jgi:hypothetical protein